MALAMAGSSLGRTHGSNVNEVDEWNGLDFSHLVPRSQRCLGVSAHATLRRSLGLRFRPVKHYSQSSRLSFSDPGRQWKQTSVRLGAGFPAGLTDWNVRPTFSSTACIRVIEALAQGEGADERARCSDHGGGFRRDVPLGRPDRCIF